MGRKPCCDKEGLNRGAWSSGEDKILTNYIETHGEGKWTDLPKRAGLNRCGKSCRLRWLNYLRPDVKRGNITADEEDLILRLHKLLGNRWSLIAGRLPGRTDNEIKNYWNTNLSKISEQGSEKAHHDHRSSSTNSKEGMKKSNQQVKVIRTKAFKCTKVVLPSHLEGDLHQMVDRRNLAPSSYCESPRFPMAHQEKDSSDFHRSRINECVQDIKDVDETSKTEDLLIDAARLEKWLVGDYDDNLFQPSDNVEDVAPLHFHLFGI